MQLRHHFWDLGAISHVFVTSVSPPRAVCRTVRRARAYWTPIGACNSDGVAISWSVLQGAGLQVQPGRHELRLARRQERAEEPPSRHGRRREVL